MLRVGLLLVIVELIFIVSCNGRAFYTSKAGYLERIYNRRAIATIPCEILTKKLNNQLVHGRESSNERIKPYEAVDMGSIKDLPHGQNPKIIIFNGDTFQLNGSSKYPQLTEIEIWQPWIKWYCNFATRVIIPSRLDILKILQTKKQFIHQVHIEMVNRTRSKRRWIQPWSKRIVQDHNVIRTITFKPTLLGRLLGRHEVVMKSVIGGAELLNEEKWDVVSLPSIAPKLRGYIKIVQKLIALQQKYMK